MAKKLSWFPLYGNIQGAVEEMRPDNVGKAVLAALRYFNEGETPKAGTMDSEASFLFRVLKKDIAKAESNYQTVSEKKSAAARARWEKERNKKNTSV